MLYPGISYSKEYYEFTEGVGVMHDLSFHGDELATTIRSSLILI